MEGKQGPGDDEKATWSALKGPPSKGGHWILTHTHQHVANALRAASAYVLRSEVFDLFHSRVCVCVCPVCVSKCQRLVFRLFSKYVSNTYPVAGPGSGTVLGTGNTKVSK